MNAKLGVAKGLEPVDNFRFYFKDKGAPQPYTHFKMYWKKQ
jgi:hypothetical protein